MNGVPCIDCGGTADELVRLCASCIERRVVERRAEQGLPPSITDPAVLDRLDRLTRVAAVPDSQERAS